MPTPHLIHLCLLLLLLHHLPTIRAHPVRPARLLLSAAHPTFPNPYTASTSPTTTWYSAADPTFSSPSVTLSGPTTVCPADYPRGFTVVCDPGPATAAYDKAVFKVAGVVVKTASRTWFGPFQIDGYFRGPAVVWEGFASGDTVACLLGGKVRVQATIKAAC